jgi:hypothetical protein
MLSLQVTSHVREVTSEGLQIKAIGGNGWQYAVDDVITDIEHHVYGYWIAAAGRRAELIIAQRPNGSRILKTRVDGFEPNSLLALPEYLDPKASETGTEPVNSRPRISSVITRSSRQARGRRARAAA